VVDVQFSLVSNKEGTLMSLSEVALTYLPPPSTLHAITLDLIHLLTSTTLEHKKDQPVKANLATMTLSLLIMLAAHGYGM
jgi:hypothetical protein